MGWRARIALALALALAALQLWPVDRTAPAEDPGASFEAVLGPPADIHALIERSCADCHSHRTQWPWYAHLRPVSFWLRQHVEKGRRNMNLSQWADYSEFQAARKLEQMARAVEAEEMPLPSYLWVHRASRLDADERARLADWARAEHRRLRASLEDE